MSLDERNDLMSRWKTMKKSQKDAIVKKNNNCIILIEL